MNFKRFLQKIISESGKATEKWDTSRANKSDIDKALSLASDASGIPKDELKSNLLGSTELALLGKKKDAGDIDIAILFTSDEDMMKLHNKMMDTFNNEGTIQKGLKVASYAVPVSKDKKVQLDFMFVPDTKWAKFNFFSSEGNKSKYKGAIRTYLLIIASRFKLKDGEDLTVFDDKGNLIARTSMAWKPSAGIERVFKIAPMKAKGEGRLKSMVNVSPEKLKSELVKIDPKYKNIKFSDKPEFINDPNKAAEHLFGKGTKASDLDSAEEIVALIKKNYSKDLQEKIFKEVAKEFPKPIELPPEINAFR